MIISKRLRFLCLSLLMVITLHAHSDPINIGGNITSDTVLVADQAYDVTSDIIVDPGVVLTVPEGTSLSFVANTQLQVQGNLVVSGTSGSPVTFTSGASTPAASDWRGIVVESGGTVTIDNAVVEYADKGIEFKDNSAGTVNGSTFSNGKYGLYMHNNDAAPVFTGSTFTGNEYGVYLQGYYWSGPNFNPAPVITGGSIYNNSVYNYYTNDYADHASTILDARGNWWGSADPTTIASTIYDYTDNTGRSAIVSFSEYLDGEGGSPVSKVFAGANQDVTLVSGESYDIAGIVEIASGVTLTIESGVTFRGTGSGQINVRGNLVITGTAVNPVTFTSGASKRSMGSDSIEM